MSETTYRQIAARIVGALVALAFPAFGGSVSQNINGLQITIDSDTGSILRMAYPGPGAMLESAPNRASIIDLAYPVKAFEPLRLASRFSTGAKITRSPDSITIHWDKLGLSRSNFLIAGNVSASVRLSANPDGKSIIMTAQVENHSDNEVRQVIFPDFPGLRPFDGELGTWFRCGGFSGLPFPELARTEARESTQYMIDTAAYAVEHKSGGMFNDMFLRWMDFGGLKGGMSLFPRRWGFDPPVTIRLQRSEVDTTIRLLNLNDVTLKKGEKWESGEWILTPHRHGWAEGIEPFREWVQRHYQREFSMPKHVREGIGYRTAWMCQNQPNDPQDAVFKFSDLPALARECEDHGIDEMVLWSWNKGFTLPLPGPYPHLGTAQEMASAIRQCRQLGVNVVPFISVLQANPKTAPRYGLKVVDNNGWTFHTELIPEWNPPYASGFSCVQAGPCNQLWHDDVLAGVKRLADQGIPSLCWDQFWTTKDPAPNMLSLANEIRTQARKADPESTFSGEELWNMEMDSGILDYTWDWGGYRDCQAFTSVFPSPRINCCVSSSALTVKKAFADNLYLNVFPRKADSINGSDWIVNRPEMSKALKQCAKLKRQFMNYFTDGKLIGDCIFSTPCADAHACAYTRADRAIVVMINLGPKKQKISFDTDLEPWTKSASGRYEVRHYNAEAKRVATAQVPAKWHGHTQTLEPEEMTIIEFVAQ
jgi:hypothetical protein